MHRVNRSLLAALTLAASAAQATTIIPVATDGTWYAFDVDQPSTGSTRWIDASHNFTFDTLYFTFTVPVGLVGKLTVVDAGYAGDVFGVDVNAGGALIVSAAQSSGATHNFPSNVGIDFDAAMADGAYSRLVLTLAPGAYTVTGQASAFAADDLGAPFDTNVGGLKVALVPEPATYASLLAGLALLGVALRRRAV